ncbi:MAG: cytochrome b N-terminal domain-containing protein [bacterium]
MNWKKIQDSRVWRSVFRTRLPIESNLKRSLVIFNSLTLHIHPVKVRERAIRFSYTFYLGMISFFLFAILTVTGILLMLYYQPAVPNAYVNMKDLKYVISYGMWLRNVHRWAAHLMVISVFLHLLRVFYHGAYKPPREFNWVIGVLLLILTLLLSYTGYLLPYDQLAYWAVTVGASIVEYVPLMGKTLRFLLLGGNEIGANTLVRFYVLHCIILPLFMIGLIALHFWRIRKDGGLHTREDGRAVPQEPEEKAARDDDGFAVEEASGPVEVRRRVAVFPSHVPERFKEDKPQEKLVTTFPHLIVREVICFQVVFIVVALISLFFDAPLEMLANPVNTPNPAKAPWYFLGVQELLHSFPPIVAGVFIPVVVILALMAIPYIAVNIERKGLWADVGNRRKTMILLTVATLGIAGIGWLYGVFSIAIPTVILYGLAVIPYFVRREKGWITWLARRPLADWIMTWFVIVVTVLTLIGTHFRGPEWRWVWPWG